MARGESGRIVIEIDPEQKDTLYNAITKNGLTLKNWFIQQATQYLSERDQMLKATVVSERSKYYEAKVKPAVTSGAKNKNKHLKQKLK